MKITYTPMSNMTAAEACRDLLVRLHTHCDNLASTSRDCAAYAKTQKETRFYEGRNSAFAQIAKLLTDIKVNESDIKVGE